MDSPTLHGLVSLCSYALMKTFLERAGHWCEAVLTKFHRFCHGWGVSVSGPGAGGWLLRKGGIQSRPSSINVPKSTGKQEGGREGRQAFDSETKKPNLRWRIGRERRN